MKDTELSASYWDKWNADHRRLSQLSAISLDQRREVLRWLQERGVRSAEILDVGCGTGWMCESLAAFGTVTGTDLSRGCLDEARQRLPQATFVAGDFMALDFPSGHYDVICSLEVLSHVEDQTAFVVKLARLLKPGGLLMLATQNKPMLERWANVTPLSPGHLRN